MGAGHPLDPRALLVAYAEASVELRSADQGIGFAPGYETGRQSALLFTGVSLHTAPHGPARPARRLRGVPWQAGGGLTAWPLPAACGCSEHV